MIKSINQIRIELSEIQASHRQLNSFFWGDILRAYKENELNYPLMLGFYPNGAMLRNQTQIQLTISIADKVYKDWSNLNEVESDTLQICRDVFNVINHSTRWQSMGRVQSCSVTKFIDRTGDEVAGHTMTMQFLIRDSSSICDLPMFDYDFDQITGDACLPVQIYENGILVDTVASGGTYSYVHGDAHYIITNSIGGILYSGDIAENDTLTQPINDSVITLKNTALTVLSTTNILAEATADITAPDATATIKNTAGTTIASEAIPSGATEIVTITDSALTINSSSIGSVAAEASLDIVVNLDGSPSGSWDGNSWEVNSVCSPVAVEVNDVSKGNVPAGATLDVNLNVTPTSSSLVGNVLSITVAGQSVGATLPHSGENVSYRTGDDYSVNAGRATDFLTLGSNNPFGNTNRFTDELGGSTYTNNIAIDWTTYDGSTVLGYYRVPILSNVTAWNGAVDDALTFSIGSFTSGWHLTSMVEFFNLLRWTSLSTASTYYKLNYPPFNISADRYIWTSTTYSFGTTQAYFWRPLTGTISTASKTTENTYHYLPCRYFTVTGTTLS